MPPLKAWLDTLDDAGREAAGREYLALFADGALTREYVLVNWARSDERCATRPSSSSRS